MALGAHQASKAKRWGNAVMAVILALGLLVPVEAAQAAGELLQDAPETASGGAPDASAAQAGTNADDSAYGEEDIALVSEQDPSADSAFSAAYTGSASDLDAIAAASTMPQPYALLAEGAQAENAVNLTKYVDSRITVRIDGTQYTGGSVTVHQGSSLSYSFDWNFTDAFAQDQVVIHSGDYIEQQVLSIFLAWG